MEATNAIGLNAAREKQLADKLNELLANYSIFYQNVRGYHWNVRGENFFELHLKFEELYSDLLLKIDEVAERILTLGHTPHHRYSDYSKMAKVMESSHIPDGRQAIENILWSLKTILIIQREILTVAAEAGDEGTNALMSDYIREQEKLVWMYSAYMNR